MYVDKYESESYVVVWCTQCMVIFDTIELINRIHYQNPGVWEGWGTWQGKFHIITTRSICHGLQQTILYLVAQKILVAMMNLVLCEPCICSLPHPPTPQDILKYNTFYLLILWCQKLMHINTPWIDSDSNLFKKCIIFLHAISIG